MVDLVTLKAKIETIKGKRAILLKLLENPNLGTLRLDVNQALEELDELVAELDQSF
ncbi:hypothetical protein NIES970_05820 [[Synechococcus] sp. NIES-970]|uniref:hypothetical protein n=1 Tax=Picosynechococcus sp. NKBG15041c TaxID=1407650 RepID=UPI0004080F6A|nr:hypothetical protein [Picosynechococcus sp. NKBG15041c]BAW95672.1 hypothetical protein NIES970_05820 [[Synechococcus] sp. NIES-970]